jgi:hypothetical protein
VEFFHRLGLDILEAWRRADFDGRVFPDLAVHALRERPPSANVDSMDVVRWVHETPMLVEQANVDSNFGEPPITVFRCERFYIDVLFWVDGTTLIHEHAFSGAFHLMEGSSIQSTFRFLPTRRYCERLMLGVLELRDVELLSKGDARPIHPGEELIHSLFHLDRPSVSVVVRTSSEAFTRPQFDYSHAGIAADPFAKSESMVRKIQTLDLLHDLRHPEFERTARDAVLRADSFLAFNIIVHVMKRIGPVERCLAFLESVRPAHEALVDALKASLAQLRRIEHIASCRQRAKQADHRFFLALLMCVRDRPGILELVQRRYPNHPPVATIAQWLAEMSKIDAIDTWVATVASPTVDGEARRDEPILDVRLDEPTLEIVKHLLQGAPDEVISARMRETSPPLAAEEVSKRCAALRGSTLLGPLFTP